MAPLLPDVAKGNGDEVGSLALLRGSVSQYGWSIALADFNKNETQTW